MSVVWMFKRLGPRRGEDETKNQSSIKLYEVTMDSWSMIQILTKQSQGGPSTYDHRIECLLRKIEIEYW